MNGIAIAKKKGIYNGRKRLELNKLESYELEINLEKNTKKM